MITYTRRADASPALVSWWPLLRFFLYRGRVRHKARCRRRHYRVYGLTQHMRHRRARTDVSRSSPSRRIARPRPIFKQLSITRNLVM